MKTLILGVGSSILTDDSVGLVVARRLAERLSHRDDVDFGENEEAGFTLLEEGLGYDRLVIVDSILTGAAPGTVLTYDLSDLGRSIHSNSPHGLNLATVLAFGKSHGMAVPDEVVIYAIEKVSDEARPALDLANLATGSDPPALMAQRLLALEQMTEEGRAALERARHFGVSNVHPVLRSRVEKEMAGDEGLREVLLRAGLDTLEELLAQPGDRGAS